MAESDTSDEIWNGISQFSPRNTSVVDSSHFNSIKAMSHFRVHIKSTFLVMAYNGVAIYEKFFINIQ